ncbi:MAG: hypothetical protein PVJ67_03795 [Candidatus Pacearchaeota archaeon]|jgi:hypothetical protein
MSNFFVEKVNYFNNKNNNKRDYVNFEFDISCLINNIIMLLDKKILFLQKKDAMLTNTYIYSSIDVRYKRQSRYTQKNILQKSKKIQQTISLYKDTKGKILQLKANDGNVKNKTESLKITINDLSKNIIKHDHDEIRFIDRLKYLIINFINRLFKTKISGEKLIENAHKMNNVLDAKSVINKFGMNFI